jgi:hypothetical protein
MAGLCVLLAAVLFIAGCSNGTTDGTTDNLLQPPQAALYAGTSGSGGSSTTYTLTVYDNGDYVLVIASGGTVKTSSGTVSGGQFHPQYPSASQSFTITRVGNDITDISGTITLDDGTTETAPGSVTPVTPEAPASSNSIVGTWEPDDNRPWIAPDEHYFDSGSDITVNDYDYRTITKNGKTATYWTFNKDKSAEVLAVLNANGIPYRGRTGEKGYGPGAAPPTEVAIEGNNEGFLVFNAGESDWAKYGNNPTLEFSDNNKLTVQSSGNWVSYSFNGTSLTMWTGNKSAIANAVISGDYLIIGQSPGFNIGGVYKKVTQGN